MKIAQVCHHYLPHIGGVEIYVKRLVESLQKKGVNVEVLTTDINTPELGRKNEAKYFKTTFEFMRNPFSLDFIKYLKKSKYDILHVHSVWFVQCFIAVYFRKNARVVATVHGVYPDEASATLKLFLSLYKPIVKYVLRKSESIFVYSPIEQKKLKEIFGVPASKIVVAPMAINIEKDDTQQRERVILFTGRVIPDKNPDLLLKAAARLDSKFKDFKLVFVGPVDDKYKQELIDLSVKLGIDNEVRFIEQLDPSVEQERIALMNHYRKASLFVSLGSWEGQPTRLMEAMQFKTPVIAFAAGGTTDFIIDNKNGLVIDRLDPDMLAKKIEKVLSNESFAANLGEEARSTIIEGYNWDKTFRKILDVYEK